ncbi:hypothetical protein HO133_006113 [Letharia lupina]|uniref:Uncharacterized protein n=1 Tax=Letharia lupina TaxID=560253 RepID=A0A8H6C7N3_9LECA|nr:uncharacterized protein HO133_006113 [Letharia lupina]KAF6218154.1 hypothetical protein HO133_006113 [Letharia lupina]
MGCAQSRPSANYYDEYFRPAQPPHRRYRSHRIANVDGYKPGPDYREHRQQYEQDVAADRYEDAYDRLTARSKLSTAHGLQEYYEDRGCHVKWWAQQKSACGYQAGLAAPGRIKAILPFKRHTLQLITTNHPPIHHAHNPIQQPHNPPPKMGATLSCLANDVSIADHPHEAPLPARPVSQQQLSRRQIQVPRRQPLQLEYSSEHGDEVPSYRRQVAQRPRRESLPVDYVDGHEEDVARFPGVRSQRQRQRPQRLRLDYQYGHDEEIPRLPYRSSPQRGALQREASYDEDGDDEGEASVSPPQFPPHQLPRRSSLPPPHSYSYEYDSDILRHERRPRRQSTRPRYEIEALPAPVYGDGLPERRMRRDQGLRGRESGSGDAPPSYEDHVFDREVGEG